MSAAASRAGLVGEVKGLVTAHTLIIEHLRAATDPAVIAHLSALRRDVTETMAARANDAFRSMEPDHARA